MNNNQANTNTVSNRIKHSVFKSSTSSKSKSNNATCSTSLEVNGLSKNSLTDSNDNGGFPIASTSNSVKQPTKPASNLSHVNSINHTSSSLKSSVKRLFSPISNKNPTTSSNINTHIINNQIASLPSGADATMQPSSTPLISTKKHQNSMRQQAPVANQMQQSQANKTLDKSLEASVFSTKSDHLSTSTSSATSTLSTSTSGQNMTTSNTSSLYISVKSNNQECNSKMSSKKKENDVVKKDYFDDILTGGL